MSLEAESNLQRNLPDNAGSHFVISTLYAVALSIRLKDTLRVLVTEGPNSIMKGYEVFYRNTRPNISY